MRLDTADTPQSSLKTATEFWREEGKKKKIHHILICTFTLTGGGAENDFKISLKSFQLPNDCLTDISLHTLFILVSESSMFLL